MTLDEYQIRSSRTLNTDLSHESQIAMLAMGLAGETGELVDLLKKHLYHGHPLDKAKVVNELGDILFYLSGLALEFNVPLAHVAEENLAKLMARYPQGFTTAASIARVDVGVGG